MVFKNQRPVADIGHDYWFSVYMYFYFKAIPSDIEETEAIEYYHNIIISYNRKIWQGITTAKISYSHIYVYGDPVPNHQI